MATPQYANSIKKIELQISFYIFLLAIILVSSCTTSNPAVSEVKPVDDSEKVVDEAFKLDENIPWSQRMTESIIKRNPESWMTDFRKTPRWSYTHGLVLLAIQKVYYETGDDRYMQYVKSYADTMITEEGEIKNYKITDYNIDNINPGKILFALHKETNDDRYERVIKTLKKQLKWQPRTSEGGYWHKLRYPYQIWLDGLYMGEPFYAQYAVEYNTPEAFDDIANQFMLCEKRTRSAQSGLLYHGWDESRIQSWSNPESGKSAEVWGRAVGWFAMALVDVLDFFPKEHEGRAEIIAILQRLAATVSAVQDEKTGTWYQVMDKPDAIGNYQEATVTCMLSYALAKGVRMGYLDSKYLAVAKKAYQGILNTFVEVEDSGEMHIHKCCAVAGLGGDPYRDGTYDYYINERIISNDTKATGPFIMASLEFERMAKQSTPDNQD